MKKMMMRFVRSAWDKEVRRDMWRHGEMHVCLIMSMFAFIFVVGPLVTSMI